MAIRPGCGGRWGACIDTRCASVPESQLPERLGRAKLKSFWPPRLAGSMPTPAGSPPWAGARRLQAGSLPIRWSWAVERSVRTRGKGVFPLLFSKKRGSNHSMAMLTFELTSSLPEKGETVIRPAVLFGGLSGQRQLPG